VVPGQVHAGHLADADAGDAHLVVGLDATSLGEGGLVGVAATDEGHVAGLEGHHQQRQEHGDADRPDRDRVAFAEGSAHESLHLAPPTS
jgi:hypothetical protein